MITRVFSRRALSIIVIILAILRPVNAGHIEDLQQSFLNPPDDSRIMMRWWWFGPAVTKSELEHEMRLMKDAGIGGFEVQPVYPLALDSEANGIKTLPFLSDGFLDALRFTSEKAKDLGLRFDLTLGSGWPFGGPTVSIDHAAGRLRYEHMTVDELTRFVKVPSIGAGEQLLAVFVANLNGKKIAYESVQEVSQIVDGIADLGAVKSEPGLQHSREVMFFISSRTGMQVKRPAVGAEGFVLDHLNREATDGYLDSVGARLFQVLGNNRPYSIFCDSLEVYNTDWSSDFLEEFKKRRGYDLRPRLPMFVNDGAPETKRLRRDWGRTLFELLNERFLAPIQAWSKARGTRFRVQDYGVPAAAISSNAFVDIPDGEGAQWKVVRAARWASSASHLYNRPVSSSETWTWLHSPAFRATPLDVKAEADIHFLQGINQLIGHGWPYSAPGVEYPGWRFYAAGVFNEKNPWWLVMPDLSKYLQRVSFMMRQGQPANDVALYLPNDDGWAEMKPGNPHLIEALREHVGADLMPTVFEAGYNLDFFDDDSFKSVGRIDKGSLILGNNRYKVIILPAVETISLETYQQFEEFVRGGGILMATRRSPSDAPGLQASSSDRNQVAQISKRLFGGSNANAQLIENEKSGLGPTLQKLLPPDLNLSPSAADIGFVHRRDGDTDIYFVANTSNQTKQLRGTFRVSGSRAEMWNPFDGTVASLPASRTVNGQAIDLVLAPYESRVIVFTKRGGPNGEAQFAVPVPDAMDLSSGWTITLGSKTELLEKLASWSERDDSRYFSGVATYKKTFTADPKVFDNRYSLNLDLGEGKPITPLNLRNGMQAWLDGPVREAAVIYINDKRAGSIWCPPYRLDVTNFLRQGSNELRIDVGNTAMNYMAGHSLPDYRLLNLRYGERFQPQDMDKIEALPSGLLGPIRLTVGVRKHYFRLAELAGPKPGIQ